MLQLSKGLPLAIAMQPLTYFLPTMLLSSVKNQLVTHYTLNYCMQLYHCSYSYNFTILYDKINIGFRLLRFHFISFYAGIMLNAFKGLHINLDFKLCWHYRPGPSCKCIVKDCLTSTQLKLTECYCRNTGNNLMQ